MNAQEFGALGDDGGRIKVTWNPFNLEGLDCLDVRWREQGVALELDTQRRKGFGSELIERMLPYELNARTCLEWTREGIQVQLFIPARAGSMVWQAVRARTA